MSDNVTPIRPEADLDWELLKVFGQYLNAEKDIQGIIGEVATELGISPGTYSEGQHEDIMTRAVQAAIDKRPDRRLLHTAMATVHLVDLFDDVITERDQ